MEGNTADDLVYISDGRAVQDLAIGFPGKNFVARAEGFKSIAFSFDGGQFMALENDLLVKHQTLCEMPNAL